MITALHLITAYKKAGEAFDASGGETEMHLDPLIDLLARADDHQKARAADFIEKDAERRRLEAELVQLDYEIWHESFQQAMAILNSYGFTMELLTLGEVAPMLSQDEQELVGAVIAEMAARSAEITEVDKVD
jgi:hypothetical protein